MKIKTCHSSFVFDEADSVYIFQISAHVTGDILFVTVSGQMAAGGVNI